MKKIYISPSTQYNNRYGDGIHNEMQVMEQVGKLLVDKLIKYNIEPIMRTRAEKLAPARPIEANALGCDLYIELHTNAGGGVGCETYYQIGVDKTPTVRAISKSFAQRVNDAIASITTLNPRAGDRGIKARTLYNGLDGNGELRACKIPAILAEIEFHDTPQGAKWIVDNMDRIAEVIAQAVVAQLGLVPRFIPSISYLVHVQNIGNMPRTKDGEVAGTTGQHLQIEAVTISVNGGELKFRGHVQDIGWQPFVENNMIAGTMGLGKQLEALEMELNLDGYQLRARGHVQDIGWQEYAVGKSVIIGTTGMAKQLEALQIEIIPAGEK